MLTSNELELQSTLTLGTLESNAETIKTLVLAKLEDYTPENYIGKAAEAKADRAVLNNAEKALNAKRLELERQYMEPFNKFKAMITDTCKAIKQASAGLDEIVKGEENREKEEKFMKIQEYWDSTGFTLFDISKVFDSKWTNKTTKLEAVKEDIDRIQKKVFDDLKVLENFPAEDVGLLKTTYLDTLDVSQAMQKAEQLKANRERLAREKIEREAIEAQKAQQDQRKEETVELNRMYQPDDTADLAAVSLGLEIEQAKPTDREEFALVLKGTREALLEVRCFMTSHGVTYTKLEDKGNGVYTAQ